MPRSRIVILAVLSLFLAIFLAATFWPRAEAVDLATAEKAPLALAIREEARAEVRDPYIVSAPAAGRLSRIELEPGDAVEKGAVVALILPADPSVLDPRTVQQAEAAVEGARAALASAVAQVARAEADLDYHRADLARMEALREADAVAEREYEAEIRAVRSAEAALDAAEAAVDRQEAELARARALLATPAASEPLTNDSPVPAGALPVRAPADGVVLQVHHESEGVVQAGEPLLEIGDPLDDLHIVAELLSNDAVAVEPGDPVRVEAWGGPVLDAVVERVEPWAFTKYSALGVEEQRVRVTMRLLSDQEARARLGHGYRTEVEIVIWRSEEALQIPSSALFRTARGWAVFAMDEGRAQRRAVSVGVDSGRNAQLLSGVEPGTRVVLYPSGDIEDGSRIKERPATGG